MDVGQGILGKAQFVDGKYPEYNRTYLVVYVDKQKIGVLNVSSTAGKEYKLLFPTNKQLINFDPPFKKDCFVKLDSLVYIPAADFSKFHILHNGDCLDQVELDEIIRLIRPKLR